MENYSKLYNKAKSLKAKYNNEVEYIKNNYAKVAIEDQLAKLEESYTNEFTKMRKENNSILENYINSYKSKQEEYRKTGEYKDRLSYSLDMISKFPNLSGDSMDQLLQPLVDAGDSLTLKILQESNPSNTSITKAIYNMQQDTSKMKNMNKYMDNYLSSYKDTPVNYTVEAMLINNGITNNNEGGV